jgi:MFS family permease
VTPTSSPTNATPASIRSLGLTVYLPSFIFSVGQGAVIPIVALVARDLGASPAMAGFVVALRGIGTLAFDIPAGMLVSRLGERRAMAVGTMILLGSLVGCVVSPSVPLFGLFMFLMGCSWAVWLLARLSYVSDVMPIHLRGRALSTLGGTMRVGNFIGPFLGAVAIGVVGLDGAYYVHIVLGLVGCAVLFLIRDPHSTPHHVGHGPVSFRAVGRAHARVWLTAGVGVLCIGLLRSTRQVALPLWADHVGVDAAAISVVFGISSAMDMVLFYPAGAASDRWGRKLVAVSCMSFLALGLVLLPLSDSFATLVLVGLVLGFGNGLGSGIVMTLGSDFAPTLGKAEFLGLWRLIGDVGTAGGPLLVAGVAATVGLGPASIVAAAIGCFGAVVMATRLPEPLPRGQPVPRSTGDALNR